MTTLISRTVNVSEAHSTNPLKSYLVKRTKSGHYYLAQMVCGKVVTKFVRTTLNHVGETLGFDNNMVQGWFRVPAKNAINY